MPNLGLSEVDAEGLIAFMEAQTKRMSQMEDTQ